MNKKTIKLTESDLIHIIHKVLNEQSVVSTSKPKPVTP